MTARKGDWIQTFTGKQFFPLDPYEDDIDIVDIAHALAYSCRYNGHCHTYYSVAEHSCWVASYAPTEFRLEALLHDASEAYITDVPRPLKPFLTNYREIEEHLESVIAKKFKLQFPFPPVVKDLDNRILIDELEAVMGPQVAPWNLKGEPLGIRGIGWSPETAKSAFLSLFRLYER